MNLSFSGITKHKETTERRNPEICFIPSVLDPINEISFYIQPSLIRLSVVLSDTLTAIFWEFTKDVG